MGLFIRKEFVFLFVFLPCLVTACTGPGVHKVERHFSTPSDSIDTLQTDKNSTLHKELNVNPSSDGLQEYLKVHMDNGNLYVLRNSNLQTEARLVSGKGYLLNPARDTVSASHFTLGMDSVAIMETNKLTHSPVHTSLIVFTGLSLGVSGVCAANPKACFGSCPTFYSTQNGEEELKAEGFSSSIAPSLEENDLDALSGVTPDRQRVTLTMKNEALETHVVRRADLLAVPQKNPSLPVYVDLDGNFWQISREIQPDYCQGEQNSCLKEVRKLDGRERTRPADSTNLAAREQIEIGFDKVRDGDGSYGIVIGQRQSLITTFLFYQALDYMGPEVGNWYAMLERMPEYFDEKALLHRLGGIQVQAQNAAGNWQTIRTIKERGPLATDVNLIEIPDELDPTTIRLDMARGNYRIDYVSMVQLEKQVSPKRLEPTHIVHNDTADTNARTKLTDSTRTLTTLPGDVYTLQYQLPDQDNYTLFLDSKGYYIEWMRPQWMQKSEPEKISELLFETEQALKRLAPVYKDFEPEMRQIFWNSRYATPSY